MPLKNTTLSLTDGERDRIFSENYPEIQKLLASKHQRWRLKYLKSMDYDDVCQIIKVHIYKKLHLWDQKYSFGPWCNRVVCNQMINLVQKHHDSKARPCLTCPYVLPDGGCNIFGSQNSACKKFAAWEKNKAAAYYLDYGTSFDVKAEYLEGSQSYEDTVDIEHCMENLHPHVIAKLDKIEAKVYTFIYVDGLNELEAARKMGYRTEKGRKSSGFKYIGKVERKILAAVKEVIEERGIHLL